VDAIQAHGGLDFELHLFLALALLGGECATKVLRKINTKFSLEFWISLQVNVCHLPHISMYAPLESDVVLHSLLSPFRRLASPLITLYPPEGRRKKAILQLYNQYARVLHKLK